MCIVSYEKEVLVSIKTARVLATAFHTTEKFPSAWERLCVK